MLCRGTRNQPEKALRLADSTKFEADVSPGHQHVVTEHLLKRFIEGLSELPCQALAKRFVAIPSLQAAVVIRLFRKGAGHIHRQRVASQKTSGQCH
jgi:hypothetical protein